MSNRARALEDAVHEVEEFLKAKGFSEKEVYVVTLTIMQRLALKMLVTET